jgi:Dna[CI] antecedent, DciA
MPPREFITPRAKREELKTYRELALRRDLKSKIQRRRVEADGLRRVLGDGSATQPYLIVETRRYRQVRLEMQRQLLLQARKTGLELPVDRLLRQIKPRIEALTYTQLAEESGHEALRHIPVAALGRALTTEEQSHFAASRAASDSPVRTANQATRTALNHVLGSIEQRQTHNPARYQTLWAQLVGPDAAQQSHLDHIDPNTQTAYFRCYNSVLSTDLQRRRGLAEKLARALGLPIRQLRAKF